MRIKHSAAGGPKRAVPRRHWWRACLHVRDDKCVGCTADIELRRDALSLQRLPIELPDDIAHAQPSTLGGTAALAVALKEAHTPQFKGYAEQIVKNSKALCEGLKSHGFRLVTGGSDNHMAIVDLTPKGLGGKPAAIAMEKAGLVANYNTIPFDPRKPFDPSGVRIGTPSITSHGMRESEMARIAEWMDRAVTHHDDDAVLAKIAGEVSELCRDFPAPGLELA